LPTECRLRRSSRSCCLMGITRSSSSRCCWSWLI
jgi:hypothetical protein